MDIFTCEICKYTSKVKSNYTRHCKSKKHKKKCNIDEQIKTQVSNLLNGYIQVEINPTPSKHQCIYCNNIFSRSTGLVSHYNVCEYKKIYEFERNIKLQQYKTDVKKNKIDVKNNTEMEKIKTEISMLKKLNKQYKHETKFYKSLVIESGIMIKKSIGSFAFLMDKFADAPVLTEKTIPLLDDIDYDEIQFGEDLILNYKHKMINKYLGDMILESYKTEDPSKQALWNTDSSRHTYFIKEMMKDNTTIWTIDKKGCKTKSVTITPLLIKVRDIVAKYQKHLCNLLSDDISSFKMNEYTEAAKDASYLIRDIDDEKIEQSILNYISPKLNIKIIKS